jgi:hypothetical protein
VDYAGLVSGRAVAECQLRHTLDMGSHTGSSRRR